MATISQTTTVPTTSTTVDGVDAGGNVRGMGDLSGGCFHGGSFANDVGACHPISDELYLVIASGANHSRNRGTMDCFVAIAPLRKRSSFVAGNDSR